MDYNHRQFKSLAGRLAELFESAEGERILRLITQLSAPRSQELKKPADETAKLRVGTWEATDEGTGRSFVRVATADPWHLWANVQKIPPKGSRRRVVLIGESVARGLLFDPHFTPAQALQQMMNVACGPARIEVVDLARTDLLHEQLHHLLTQALHLEPDAFVVFCGNNWNPLALPSEEQFLDMATAFRETGSWRGVKESCEQFLITQTKQTLRLLEEIVDVHRVPVVFVLPEFNLADWQTECDTPPLLDAAQTETWLRARGEAEQLLQSDEWEKAEPLADRLLQLDQGTTAAGPNIFAEIARRRGDQQMALTFLEQARDATVCWPFRQTPRCFSVIQQTLREGAAAHGVQLVDLPREFTKRLAGAAAGRSLFLDYCHLTLEGIRIAMALTAETLLPLLKYPARSGRELERVDLKISADVNANAHFLAAVHSANWGQSMEVVRHHVRTALELDRGVANMMQLFLDLHLRHVPSGLCHSFDQLCQLQSIPAMIAFYNDSPGQKFLNTNLITAIGEELEAAGIATREFIERLLIKEHGVNRGVREKNVRNRGVDLVDPVYSTGSFARSLVDLRPEFYKATARNTIFPLVCDKAEALDFVLTVKVPDAGPDQTISLRLNGNLIAELPATNRWTTSTISANAAVVHRGLNQVEILWPMPSWSGDQQREHVAACLEAGEVVEITPLFGLIHSLRVMATEKAQKTQKTS